MAALVQTYSHETGTITMLQTRPTSATGRMPSGQQQFGHSPQAPRATYHGNATFGGYRGSSTPVQQYAFQSTPSLNNTFLPPAAGGAQDPRDDSARHGGPVSGHSQPSFSSGNVNKAAPDRYRRTQPQAGNHSRSQSATLPATANLSNTASFYNVSNSSKVSMANRPASFYATTPGTSMDDMHIRQSTTKSNETDSMTLRPRTNHSAHSRTGSSDSVNSSRSNHSRPSSANRSASAPTVNPSLGQREDKPSIEHPKSVTVPPRGSSTDAAKRTTNPSPLSKPVTMGNDTADRPSSPAASGNLDTPAAKQLAAISLKGGKAKSKTSRLRRAFSFGSAAELRKAAAEGEAAVRHEASRLHKEPNADEAYDAEQARIAEQQEAAGIGSSIYGGRFFSGSTDNLSISSTASSASIMIRKMGRGMKKSTRSLAGLFRPKSVVGVPPADPVDQEGSQPSVSMVTVEAETQRVIVSAEPQRSDSFPHPERNSLDDKEVPEVGHERTGSSGTDNSRSRKSIVGGDRERAEVLAAVRKGILKRSGSSSPSVRPVDGPADLPGVPAITDSPNSSAPSTPNDETHGHRRTGSVSLGNEDYFMTALRLRQDSKSAPGTPQGGTKRNATFSPRLIFHDTWPSQEYDRRGEIATCNRLTPMLAQQIKEELNTFKMEMEVHENSKIYTHFF